MSANATVIDGKARASTLRADVAISTRQLVADHGIVPTLATILVGNDPASDLYVRRKVEQTQDVGMRSLSHHLPADVEQAVLLELIQTLNDDPAVHGILVQLPLPPHVERSTVLAAINPDKDVDGFHVVNVGRLGIGEPGQIPCTPTGCMMLLTEQIGSMEGRHAVVIGCSNIVGRPMAQLLLQARCTVTVAHIHTRSLPDVVALADILVVAAGAPGLVRGAWLKPGAVVIDVGINRIVDPVSGKAKIVGDVCFNEALGRASAITPVPGGVGPMTIACLLQNTLRAAIATVPVSSAPSIQMIAV